MIAHMVRTSIAAFLVTLCFAGEPARGEEVKLPKTAEEHEAMAKSYEDKAAGWRKEAAYHREMAAAYRKYLPEFRSHPMPGEEPVKMEKHCSTIVKDAEKLAADAEESAKYHHLRAKALKPEP